MIMAHVVVNTIQWVYLMALLGMQLATRMMTESYSIFQVQDIGSLRPDITNFLEAMVAFKVLIPQIA